MVDASSIMSTTPQPVSWSRCRSTSSMVASAVAIDACRSGLWRFNEDLHLREEKRRKILVPADPKEAS